MTALSCIFHAIVPRSATKRRQATTHPSRDVIATPGRRCSAQYSAHFHSLDRRVIAMLLCDTSTSSRVFPHPGGANRT